MHKWSTTVYADKNCPVRVQRKEQIISVCMVQKKVNKKQRKTIRGACGRSYDFMDNEQKNMNKQMILQGF